MKVISDPRVSLKGSVYPISGADGRLSGLKMDMALPEGLPEDGITFVLQQDTLEFHAGQPGSKPRELNGAPAEYVPPSWYAQLVRYLLPEAPRPAIAIVGPAGNGKTTTAEIALAALGYDYVALDATEFIEPSDLAGRMSFSPDVGEIWLDGLVTSAFKQGKAVLINEFDAMNPRASLVLQSALQDGSRYIATVGSPHGDRVYPQGPCPIVVTMNTFGSGATRTYVGRNALDAATGDRFSFIDTGYESEDKILRARGYSAALARDIAKWAAQERKKIDENGLRAILSLRTMLRMAQSIELYGLSFEQAVKEEYTSRLSPEQREIMGIK